jgi:anti-sigma28 factor (negative regulator of flagellin synthesis)
MPSESSTPSTGQRNLEIPQDGPPHLADDARIPSVAQKAAATRRRHEEEHRTDKLDQMRAQIAAGTLVVRQMSVAEHKTASRAARNALAQNDARLERSRALRTRRTTIG